MADDCFTPLGATFGSSVSHRQVRQVSSVDVTDWTVVHSHLVCVAALTNDQRPSFTVGGSHLHFTFAYEACDVK